MLSSSIVAMAQTAVSDIGALSSVEDGTEVTLTLTDAKITVFQNWGSFTVIEDATGSVMVDSNIGGGFYELGSPAAGSVLNGTLTAAYSDETGVPTLSISDNTAYSTNLTLTEGDAPTPTEMTLDEANSEANLLKVVKLSSVEVSNISYNSDSFETTFLIGDQPNTMNGNDIFKLFATDEGTSMTNGKYDITGVVYYDGVGGLVFYPIEMTKLESSMPEVDNIAALKGVEDGTEVYLTLKDAQVTVCKSVSDAVSNGMFAVLKDATGSVMIGSDLAINVLSEISAGSVLNGTLVAAYSAEYGMPVLSISTNTGYESDYKITDGDAPVATEMTVEEAIKEENLLSLVKLSSVEVSNVYYNESNFTTQFLINDKSSSMTGYDLFKLYDSVEEGTSLTNGTYDITGVVFFKGDQLVILPTEMEALSTGISSVKASDSAAKTIYNLNGQRVSKASKGLYIVNGKKVVLK